MSDFESTFKAFLRGAEGGPPSTSAELSQTDKTAAARAARAEADRARAELDRRQPGWREAAQARTNAKAQQAAAAKAVLNAHGQAQVLAWASAQLEDGAELAPVIAQALRAGAPAEVLMPHLDEEGWVYVPTADDPDVDDEAWQEFALLDAQVSALVAAEERHELAQQAEQARAEVAQKEAQVAAEQARLALRDVGADPQSPQAWQAVLAALTVSAEVRGKGVAPTEVYEGVKLGLAVDEAVAEREYERKWKDAFWAADADSSIATGLHQAHEQAPDPRARPTEDAPLDLAAIAAKAQEVKTPVAVEMARERERDEQNLQEYRQVLASTPQPGSVSIDALGNETVAE